MKILQNNINFLCASPSLGSSGSEAFRTANLSSLCITKLVAAMPYKNERKKLQCRCSV